VRPGKGRRGGRVEGKKKGESERGGECGRLHRVRAAKKSRRKSE